MYKEIHIKKKTLSSPIPKKGFYVSMTYMYDDGDTYNTKIIGPFPEEKADLLLEFLNILETMRHKDPEDYELITNYKKWFSDEFLPMSKDDALTNLLAEELGVEIEYIPNSDNNRAPLQEFDVYYHDGKTANKYEVELI